MTLFQSCCFFNCFVLSSERNFIQQIETPIFLCTILAISFVKTKDTESASVMVLMQFQRV